MNELDNLSPITKNSTRGTSNNFDIHHDVENNKFTVSDALFAQLNLENNGFTAYLGNKKAFLTAVPNDEAVSYRGREGYDKGRAFTSSEMSRGFEMLELTGDLQLTKAGEREGVTYYRVEKIEDVIEQTEEASEEEFVASEEQDVEETTDMVEDEETQNNEELV
jgi:hypothetical protein